MKLVQFGAGNIGRSFIGQVFSRAGWEVVFVDVDQTLVSRLIEKRFYSVVVKREGKPNEKRRIGPVRAIDGKNAQAAAKEIADADLIATSVGKAALPKIFPVIALGLNERFKLSPEKPLDIIIAENARGADKLFRDSIKRDMAIKYSGSSYPFDKLVGLVETSIGKMVPIMKREDLEADPLQLFAEEYEDLIVDRRGFKGPLPDIAALKPVDPIAAYVDRKLFIHNLGHAAAAYLGYQAMGSPPRYHSPSQGLLAGVFELNEVEEAVRCAMNEAAEALVLEYPDSYTRADLTHYIDDLLLRFKNKALGDTIHRVGRDLERKLGREDRLVGAMLLCARHKLPFNSIAHVYKAALGFVAPDERGVPWPDDASFKAGFADWGLSWVFSCVSSLSETEEIDQIVMASLEKS